MEIFLSIVIFIMSLYLFFITNNKIKSIKDNIIIEDMKKEMESLLAEFNGAAVRNIELMESKIGELQELINKANNKIVHLDGKIERANKPIVIEKIIEKSPGKPARNSDKELEIKEEKEQNKSLKQNDFQIKEDDIFIPPQKPELPQPSENKVEIVSKKTSDEKPVEELSRSDQIKRYLREGKTKDELINLGYMENEINLLSFLIRKNG